MAPREARRRRCATHASKSSEEGLDQDFNSLDAQREACEAYIQSQAGEGWKSVRARYEDGGFSGGSLDGVVLRRAVDIRLRRRGVETKPVLLSGEQPAGTSRVDPALVEAVLRARDRFERLALATGGARSFAQIAHDEVVTGRYVAHVVPLALLAPEIVSSILAGQQPVDLTASRLIKPIDLPLRWAEQGALLGFEDRS